MGGMDLVEFLRARLDEDEAVARAAVGPGGSAWVHEPSRGMSALVHAIGEPPAEVIVYDEGSPSDEQAEHIARHDPSRVFREVEAKRRMVDDHPSYVCVDPAGLRCHRCVAEGEVYPNGVSVMAAWPCLTLRSVALPHSDHPDYDPTWAPEEAR